ncbi:MAG: HRDC domain-containing protein [Acidobacteria bacterium]|nr:HRDC domain-containing protein [Acidobacteriota bacterium]
MEEHEYTWVRTAVELRELAAVLDDHPVHVFDTESNSGFVYDERLCLLQFEVAGGFWLVDLLALPEGRQGLDPLRAALEGAGTVTRLHGGEFDVGCLKRDFDLALGGVWDSQQAARSLGWEKTGYGSLVERVCGIALDKAFSHYDWGHRPIAPEPLRYAVQDVVYLSAVCEHLERLIREADIEEELEIANQAVMDSTWGGGYQADGFWRIKGVGGLPRQQMPVVVALYRWREEMARDLDRPPGRVLNNRLLLALSRNPPSAPGHLRRLGIHGRLVRERGRELLDVIAAARRDPPAVPPRPQRAREDPQAAKRADRLRKWRRGEGERRGVPEQVVLPSAALRHLAMLPEEDLTRVPQLGAKRVRLYGPTLEALCRN